MEDIQKLREICKWLLGFGDTGVRPVRVSIEGNKESWYGAQYDMHHTAGNVTMTRHLYLLGELPKQWKKTHFKDAMNNAWFVASYGTKETVVAGSKFHPWGINLILSMYPPHLYQPARNQAYRTIEIKHLDKQR